MERKSILYIHIIYLLIFFCTLIESKLVASDRILSGISLKLYNVMMTQAMNMNVTSVKTALTWPPSMTPLNVTEKFY